MHFTQKSDFQAFDRRWKELAHARQLTVFDVILRAVVLGRNLDTVLPLPTNANKLANGGRYNSARYLAVQAFARGSLYYQGATVISWPDWLARWADPAQPEAAPYGLTLAKLKQASTDAKGL